MVAGFGVIALAAVMTALMASPVMAASQSGSGVSAQHAAQQPSLSAAQAKAAADETRLLEEEWVKYLDLPAERESVVNRALEVKHRHIDDLLAIPGVRLVWVDADKDQDPLIHVDVSEATPDIAKRVPSTLEGVPVQVVKAEQWFLIEPPYSAPTNFREGAPLALPPLNAIQTAGQSGVSNSRIDSTASKDSWSKIGPMESEHECERGKAFLIWLASDPRYIAHRNRSIQQRRGANWAVAPTGLMTREKCVRCTEVEFALRRVTRGWPESRNRLAWMTWRSKP